MRFTVIFILILCFFSCKPSKEISDINTSIPIVDNRPSWVKKDPISPDYYIGIGIGNKKNASIDYRQQAKKNALNELASEISVNINSNSFLFAMETNTNFNEDFKSTIKTEISKYLEGYELVDSWEDDDLYKVYYRLSKTKYKLLKKEQKNKALRYCYDLYLKALEAEKNSNISLALNLNSKAILSIKKYWNEINEYKVGDNFIYLDNEISSNMHKILSLITLKPIQDEIHLTSDKGYTNTLKIKCLYKSTDLPLAPIKIEYYQSGKYTSSQFLFEDSKLSDSNGNSSFYISNPSLLKLNQEALIKLDITKMLKINSNDLKLMSAIINMHPSVEKYIPIKIILPKIYISSNEKILGKEVFNKTLLNAFKETLIKKKYEITDSKSNNGLSIYISTDTKSTLNSSKFVPAYLSGEIIVKNTNKIIYSKALTDIKGIQLDSYKASIKAYEEAAKLIHKDIISDMLKSIKN